MASRSKQRPREAILASGFPFRSIQNLSGGVSASKDASPEAFIFPSARGTAINTNNFLFRVLKEAGKTAGVPGVTHQMLRRTCSTYMAQLTTVKDVQAPASHECQDHLGALQQVGSRKRVAVESLDHLLKSKPRAVEGEKAN